MERVMEPGEIYSEKKLAELIEHATDDLEPSRGYRLKLDGMKCDLLTQKELSTYFGAYIDADKGASMTLTYNDFTNQLELQSLTMNIERMNGTVGFYRVQSGNYIPQTNLQDQLYTHKNKLPSHETIQRYLHAFGVSDIPPPGTPEYKYWQTMIIAETKAWHLREEVEMPIAFTDHATQSAILTHDTVVNTESMDIHDIRRVSQRIDQLTPDDERLRSELILELYNEGGHHVLRHYLFNGHFPHSFVANDETLHTTNLTALSLTPDSFHERANEVREIIHRRRVTPTRPTRL